MNTLKTCTIVAALVAGGTSLALSAGAALAQAPAQEVYPSYGYAPYGYGYVPSGPLYNYAAPAYGYATPAQEVYPSYGYAPYGYGYVPSGPLYNYAAPAYGYAAPPYGPATGGQPPVASATAGNPAVESIATQTARHRGSMYMSTGGGSTQKKGTLKTAPKNGGY